MNKDLINSIKVACIYTTTIIGAGFASGQEILQFFSKYHDGGFYGIILAGILFSAIGCIVLNKVYSERIENFNEFLYPMTGWVVGWIVDTVVTLFMISLYCVMIAGAGSIISSRFKIPFHYGIASVSALCIIFLLTSVRGIVNLSTVVTPILIIGMLASGFYVIANKSTAVFYAADYIKRITNNWLFSSLLYVSYNSLISVMIMCGLLPYLRTKRSAIMGGVMGGMMLCFVALILNTVIFIFYSDNIAGELPLPAIIQGSGIVIYEIYTIILWLAMFVSAVTSGYCIIDRVSSKIPINAKILSVIVCTLAMPLAGIGFSQLISKAYPVFGYLGMLMVFLILIEGIKMLIGK